MAAVVDQGGFAQAAKALRRSQSAISYSIARLQESLEVPLLRVQGRKAVLTAHGETLLRRARPLLADLSTLEELARSLQRGWESQLKLVVDVAFPRERLLQIVAELGAACPNTQLQLADAVLSGAEEAISGHSADVVVTSRVPAGVLGRLSAGCALHRGRTSRPCAVPTATRVGGCGSGASRPGGCAGLGSADIPR